MTQDEIIKESKMTREQLIRRTDLQTSISTFQRLAYNAETKKEYKKYIQMQKKCEQWLDEEFGS